MKKLFICKLKNGKEKKATAYNERFAASGGQIFRHGNPPPDSKPPPRYMQV